MGQTLPCLRERSHRDSSGDGVRGVSFRRSEGCRRLRSDAEDGLAEAEVKWSGLVRRLMRSESTVTTVSSELVAVLRLRAAVGVCNAGGRRAQRDLTLASP